MFEKAHSVVIRAVDELQRGLNKNVGTPWFVEKHERNPQNGQLYRYYEMTRDGASLLVMGFTVRDIEGEPRVLDTDLGKALGMARPETIRETIKAHREEREQFGFLSAETIKTGGRGRPATAYHLNEEQATYVTMHCKTERAQAVKVQIVKVFTAWRHGALLMGGEARKPKPLILFWKPPKVAYYPHH